MSRETLCCEGTAKRPASSDRATSAAVTETQVTSEASEARARRASLEQRTLRTRDGASAIGEGRPLLHEPSRSVADAGAAGQWRLL